MDHTNLAALANFTLQSPIAVAPQTAREGDTAFADLIASADTPAPQIEPAANTFFVDLGLTAGFEAALSPPLDPAAIQTAGSLVEANQPTPGQTLPLPGTILPVTIPTGGFVTANAELLQNYSRPGASPELAAGTPMPGAIGTAPTLTPVSATVLAGGAAPNLVTAPTLQAPVVSGRQTGLAAMPALSEREAAGQAPSQTRAERLYPSPAVEVPSELRVAMHVGTLAAPALRRGMQPAVPTDEFIGEIPTASAATPSTKEAMPPKAELNALSVATATVMQTIDPASDPRSSVRTPANALATNAIASRTAAEAGLARATLTQAAVAIDAPVQRIKTAGELAEPLLVSTRTAEIAPSAIAADKSVLSQAKLEPALRVAPEIASGIETATPALTSAATPRLDPAPTALAATRTNESFGTDLARQIAEVSAALAQSERPGSELKAQLKLDHDILGPISIHLTRSAGSALDVHIEGALPNAGTIVVPPAADARSASTEQHGASSQNASQRSEAGESTYGSGRDNEPRSRLEKRSNGDSHQPRQGDAADEGRERSSRRRGIFA